MAWLSGGRYRKPRGEIEWRLLTVTWQPDLSFNQGI
jgi:hypothetical protein